MITILCKLVIEAFWLIVFFVILAGELVIARWINSSREMLAATFTIASILAWATTRGLMHLAYK